MRLPHWIAAHLAALRAMVVLTLITGVLYPAVVLAVAQLPGLKDNADGSLLTDGTEVTGSSLIGQSYLADDGSPLRQYFQTRPSAAGEGYDPTASGASNLGPENIVDTLPDPSLGPDGDENATKSLLTLVCERSRAIGELEDVDGSRPYCADSGDTAVGAVLGVFRADGLTGRITRVVSLNESCATTDTPFVTEYRGVTVECAEYGADYRKALPTPIRGDAPDDPAVPADAVTASGSGLDPHIGVEYATLQLARVAAERDLDPDTLADLVAEHTTGRTLGFMGEPVVNVVTLNAALDRDHPVD